MVRADPAGAQPSSAAIAAQTQHCDDLSRTGDTDAALVCKQDLLNKQLSGSGLSEQMRQKMLQAQQQKAAGEKAGQKARKAREAAYKDHQRALKCATLHSDPASEGDQSYNYSYTSACRQPVTVRLCVVDGPKQPSRKRKARLQPGESVH